MIPTRRPRVLLADDHLLVAEALKKIASRLAISNRTVEFHKFQLMETLGIHTNAELIHFAIKSGLVEL
jgi:DNA-binding NarL/FixJ family response regulator